MALYPYLVCANDPLCFRAATVEAEDFVHAYELGLALVRRWRDDARAAGRPFAPKNGVQVMVKSSGGTMRAVRPG